MSCAELKLNQMFDLGAFVSGFFVGGTVFTIATALIINWWREHTEQSGHNREMDRRESDRRDRALAIGANLDETYSDGIVHSGFKLNPPNPEGINDAQQAELGIAAADLERDTRRGGAQDVEPPAEEEVAV